MKKKVVSFLVSGRGSNFSKVADHILAGDIDARLGIVLSDKKDAKALDIAKEYGMGSCFVDPRACAGREEHEKKLLQLLQEHGTDLVVAAGYMRIISPYLIGKYRNRIINIHPALLPAFPGIHAQEQAFAYGVKITGCTTHFIDEGTDTGPIIMQAAVPVHDDDTATTLAARILKEEHRILPLSVKLYCEGRLKVQGRKVTVLP